MLHTKENQFIRLEYENDGSLNGFCPQARSNPLRKYPLWRAVISYNGRKEIELRPAGTCAVSGDGDQIEFRFDCGQDRHGKLYPVSILCKGVFKTDEIHWSLCVENTLEGSVVREVQFPVLSLDRDSEPFSILTSRLGGEKVNNFFTTIGDHATAYFRQDNRVIRYTSLYPGCFSAMNFLNIDFGSHGIYCGCHDPEFRSTQHILEWEKESDRCNVIMARYPFLQFGEKNEDNTFVVSAYEGSWHVAAEKYSSWARSTFFTPPVIPEHIRQSNGWQRIILKQQCGETLIPYDELAHAAETAQNVLIDTQFLFGWTQHGMDAGYPQYLPDPEQGGLPALKKAIGEIRAKGSKVILYFNGQLIDMESEFYRSGAGQKICIKKENGSEHREFYNFGGEGSFLSFFGNKSFAVACPSSGEWKKILEKHADFALDLGVDSVFFDQLGVTTQLCFDPAHGHEVPFTGIMKAKKELAESMREYVKSRSPETGFGMEVISDITSVHSDFVHILGQGPFKQYDGRKTDPFMELFRYTFPEIRISNRDIRDDDCDYIRLLNEATLLGSFSDVEIYRCRATIAEAPAYGEYLKQVNMFREKHKEVFTDGRFMSDLLYTQSGGKIRSNGYLCGDHLAVILTNRQDETQECSISAPGYELCSFDSVRGDMRMENERVILPECSLGILIFRKK